tara:strand:- start:992 stop:1294 length:303 start_codon:yes stop_codon:yes gene_type:complete
MEHTFKISKLHRKVENGLVNKVKYRLETTHENYTTVNPSAIKLEGSISENFINYEDLTEDVILGWITGSIPVASMKQYNSASIAEHFNPIPLQEEEGTPW